MNYPQSPTLDLVDTLHGVSVPDPYRWLEEIDSQQTKAWIAAQNEFTAAYLNQIPARERIRQRLTDLWNYERYGLPFKQSGRYFINRNDGLQNQAVLYQMDSLRAEPQVLLDPNQLSADGTVALMGYSVSEDARLLAYGVSNAGSDWTEWRVREIDSGRDLADHLQWVKFSGAAWTHDGQGFFYSRYAAPAEGLAYKGVNEYQKLFYHRIGAPQAEDELIYERPDQKEWGFSASVTDDGRYLSINVWKGTQRENAVFYQDLQANDAPVVELLNQFDAIWGLIGNDGPIFYFVTDLDAPLSRVIAIDIRQPERLHWHEIIPQADDALQSANLLNGQFVATYMHDAYSVVKVFDQQGNFLRQVTLPGLGSVGGFGGRQDDEETFYQFTSFTTPGAIYRYDLETGQSVEFRIPEVAFDQAAYVTEQVFYASKDGTRIPMFITHKKGLQRNGDNPTLLYGYGGFNIPMMPAFSVNMLAWMEMGGVYAQVCLRGGGEYGKTWHAAGTKHQKQNVFDDFIAAAEWLIEQNYTSTPKLAIFGGSNGGLLVAACETQRPDLFGACLIAVGVLDMVRYHQFTIGWAWVSDYGSPDRADEFATLLAYSPYHNLKPGTAYPPTLITAGDHDDRVFPAHSFKFAAALQVAQGGAAPILIRIETRAGHGAGKPTTKVIEENADRLAFLVRNLGMNSV